MTIPDFAGLFGYIALTSAFIICAVLILISFSLHFFPNPQLQRLTEWLTHLQTALLTVSVILLGVLLQMGAFEFETVFNAVENSMSPFERIGGLWSSQAASLLFWSAIMSGAVSLSLLIAKRISFRNHIPTVVFILEFTLLFFL
ncbi:MAG: hypothetical protein MIO92_06805, partial [Methanosarcinaceae archaeon]|nr:hypothetical protein [Methanosarcinaceae archaeon]